MEETIKAPQYVIDAAQDEQGEYFNFVTYGTHPPKWLFDPTVTASKGAVGGALVESNREAYKWNMIRRNIARRGEITAGQYKMLAKEVKKFTGEQNPWFKACKKWVESE